MGFSIQFVTMLFVFVICFFIVIISFKSPSIHPVCQTTTNTVSEELSMCLFLFRLTFVAKIIKCITVCIVLPYISL